MQTGSSRIKNSNVSSLMKQVAEATSFSTQLAKALKGMLNIIEQDSNNQTRFKEVELSLVGLSCQNKNLIHYKNSSSSVAKQCVDLIGEILILQANRSQNSCEHIVKLFLQHTLSHTSCYVSYSLLQKIVNRVPRLLNYFPYSRFLEINSKLIKNSAPHDTRMLYSIRVEESIVFQNEHIEICSRNMNSYLRTMNVRSPPAKDTKTSQKKVGSSSPNIKSIKIPPLILPTSKSVNSSKFSAISREEKNKGLADLKKLASTLGQGFICVELGCLLSNKRTKQMQQFSENAEYRQHCLDKLDRIETERMNSSRLGCKDDNLLEEEQKEECLETSQRYYSKVLLINCNLFYHKITQYAKSQERNHTIQSFVKQIIDMMLLGTLIQMGDGYKQKESGEENLSVRQVTKRLMKELSNNSEKLHMYLLLNRNKSNCSFHYDLEKRVMLIDSQEEFRVQVNEQGKINKPFKQKSIKSLRRRSDPVLFYIGHWMQSLLESADMQHPMFNFYQQNLLKALSFYVNSCASPKVASYYLAQFLMPLLLLVKRQVIELSHPFLGNKNKFVNNCDESILTSGSSPKRVPFFQKHPDILHNLVGVINSLLRSCNKYLQKLMANLFFKNIYFMEVLEGYLDWLFRQQDFHRIGPILDVYSRALEVYKTWVLKKTHHFSYISLLYDSLIHLLSPKGGSIALALQRYSTYLSPSNMEEEAVQLDSDIFYQERCNNRYISDLPSQQNYIQTFVHRLLNFLSEVYYLTTPTLISCPEEQLILDEEIASFYIKYCLINYIKLYSMITVKQLINVNSQINRHSENRTSVNTKQIIMIDLLKLMTNISVNRTSEVAKKMRQFRILEFFAREIQLEFSVQQNIEKYIKKAIKLKNIQEILEEKNKKQALNRKQKKIKNKTKKKQTSSKKTPIVPKLNMATLLHNQFDQSSEDEILSLSQRHPSHHDFNSLDESSDGIDPEMLTLDLGFKKQGRFAEKEKEKKKPVIPDLKLECGTFNKGENSEQKKQITNKKGHKIPIPSLKIPAKTVEHKERKKQKKQYLDDLLAEIMEKQQAQSYEPSLSLNLPICKKSSDRAGLQSKSVQTERNVIYWTQRKIRKIYSSKILHAESIMLILSLLLYQGQLDPTYCHQMPIIHGKINVLYILHFHLNHESNQSIIPLLAENVNKIRPYLAGQRLFKLLSNSFTDMSPYSNWAKISAGAFGVVMEAETGLDEPSKVAVKQMNFPKSIYERCVLHDIFTQITCLETFRLEDRVTRMYNYGIVDNTYAIIMKRYTCSLKGWRLSEVETPETKFFPPSLLNILSIFYEVLKGLKMLHDDNVIHYDIKADNIMLDFCASEDPKEGPKVDVVFGDFGVCKMFKNQNDELDQQSRGTECIKSPEMLTLSLKNKKEADNFDRRKKIGTTKASDIWSLGCLFYQIITGQFLFNSNNWMPFFMQVTSPTQELLKSENYSKLNNNIYLIDFLKYMLIRDPHHRPSIHNILTRFENLYELLVSNPERTASYNFHQEDSKALGSLIDDYEQFMESNILAGRGFMQRTQKIQTECQMGKTGKVMQLFNPKYAGKMMKIMQDIYFCEKQIFVTLYQGQMRQQGITHLVMQGGEETEWRRKLNYNCFKVLEIDMKDHKQNSMVYKLCPKVSDMLREVLLLKGKLLFVNNQSNWCINLLIFTLSYWFRCSAFETWCLINTQILSFPAPTSAIVSMSKGLSLLNKIEKKIQGFPKLQCICGSVTIIMKKFQQKKGQMRVCRCRKKNSHSQCFTNNCGVYLELIKKRYNIAWDLLTWALVTQDQLLTPLPGLASKSTLSQQKKSLRSQILLNSAEPLTNMAVNTGKSSTWSILECKVCEMWMMAVSEERGQIWAILNNLIKSSRQGIMIPNAQQEYKTKTPALNYYTLSKLHMTGQ